MFTKRIVGVPGDRLRIANKQLYRNGAAVAEPYAKHATSYVDSYRDNFPSTPDRPTIVPVAAAMLRDNVQAGELVVPPGGYFVLGDNRDDSLDSRYRGFISKSDIIGRLGMVYLSVEAREDSKLYPPTSTVKHPSMIEPPWAVKSPMRACGILMVSTVNDPRTITSGGPTQVAMSVTRAAGRPPIRTVGAPGARIGPPTCGTSTVTMGQTCISVNLAAGIPIKVSLSTPIRKSAVEALPQGRGYDRQAIWQYVSELPKQCA